VLKHAAEARAPVRLEYADDALTVVVATTAFRDRSQAPTATG
jgi:hypothetical protein